MKFEMLDTNRIKVTVDKIDQKLWNISFDHIVCNTPKAREVFEILMEKARRETNFNACNSTLVVEATPLSNDGFVMVVTKVDEKKILETMKERRIRIKRGQHISKTMVYEFDTFDDVVGLANRTDIEIKGKTSLYELKGKYYLVISGILNFNTRLNMLLCEYAKRVARPDIKTAVIEEYAELISGNDIFKTLRQYFC